MSAGINSPYARIDIVLLSLLYALALFQRTALATLGPILSNEMGLDSAELSRIGAVFFWVYLALQLPAGLLVDAVGPRRLALIGGIFAALGSAYFSLAHDAESLLWARMAVSGGSSVAFVCLMRYISLRQPKDLARLSGQGIMVANLGAIASGAPLALALLLLPWHLLWLALAVFSLAAALGIWFFAVETHRHVHPRTRLRQSAPALLRVLSCPWTYVGIAILAGLSGSYYALAGLYATPLLAAAGIPHGIASLEISGLIAGYALGAAFWGQWGNHGPHRAAILGLAILGALICWGLTVIQPALGAMGFGLLFFCLGFFSGAFVLVFPLLTERHGQDHAGATVAVVNCGIPLGAALCQTFAARLAPQHLAWPMFIGALLALAAAVFIWQQKRSQREGLVFG